MQNEPSRMLTAARHGLVLRKCLSIMVESALVILVSAALGLLVCLLRGISFTLSMILLPGLVPGLAFFLIRLRRSRTTAVQAGLYLDHHFGLKERMCSLASLKQEERFAAALNEEVKKSVVPSKQLFDKTVPEHTCYLALPVAVITALLLLPHPGFDDRTALDAGSVLADRSGAHAAELEMKLQKAVERHRQTGSEDDLANVHALREQLQKARARGGRRFGSGDRTESEARAATRASAAEGKGAGERASIVPIRAAMVAASESLSNRVNADAILTVTPDWDRFVGVESSLPLAWRKGIQNYIAAVAAEE